MDASNVVVGIDVSKHELAIAVSPSEAQWTTATTARDRGLGDAAAGAAATLVVLEATGGYDRDRGGLRHRGLRWPS